MIDNPERDIRPELVGIRNGELSAHISTTGAWLTSLTNHGEPALFPKQSFTLPDGSQKVRGGCHVCLPNFGPGGESGLPQHGFARDLEWTIADSDISSVSFEMRQESGDYTGLHAKLKYELSETALQMILTVRNDSDKQLRVSPGFHPYFADNGYTISLDGQPVDVDSIAEAKVLDVAPAKLQIRNRQLQLDADNLTRWILWSDRLGQYVCLEPTFAGLNFEHPAEPAEILAPSVRREYSFQVSL